MCPFCEKLLPQIWHLNGFSPVWVLTCLARLALSGNILPQNWHSAGLQRFCPKRETASLLASLLWEAGVILVLLFTAERPCHKSAENICKCTWNNDSLKLGKALPKCMSETEENPLQNSTSSTNLKKTAKKINRPAYKFIFYSQIAVVCLNQWQIKIKIIQDSHQAIHSFIKVANLFLFLP